MLGSIYVSRIEQALLPEALRNMNMVCLSPRVNLLALYQSVQDYFVVSKREMGKSNVFKVVQISQSIFQIDSKCKLNLVDSFKNTIHPNTAIF